MPTVIFVHGTGVREPIAGETFGRIKAELTRRSSALNVERVYWGGELGTKLLGNGASIPDYEAARAIGERSNLTDMPDDKTAIALWDLLLQDSLYEIRLLELIADVQGGVGNGFVPGGNTPGQELREQTHKLDPHPDSPDADIHKLADLLAKGGIASVFAQSRDFVALASPTVTASQGENLAELRHAIARAIVAECLYRTDGSYPSPPAWNRVALRDSIAAQIEIVLKNATDVEMGFIMDWIKRQVVGIAAGIGEHAGTWYLRSHRGIATDKAFGFPGDIILYQARGKALRDAIVAKVQSVAEPVMLIGHSLGGVACVDTLIECPLLNVKHLITAGSQAPFFYEMDALVTLPFQDIEPRHRLPAHFPTWTNFYDKNDFLGYVGNKLFGAKVLDILVNNGMPFPDAHSGYWENDFVYDEIARRLPQST